MLGTVPPISIHIEQQLSPLLVGRTILKATYTRYYEGKKTWHGDTQPMLDEVTGGKIIFADASNILCDNGALVSYSYFDGDLRYFSPGQTVDPRRISKAETHGYHLCFYLDNGACIAVNLYSWCTYLDIRIVDLKCIDIYQKGRSGRYPFLNKPPIDITDPDDFTPERFTEWLTVHPAENIVENCSTAKGAFNLCNPVMSYILLISKVHPRTKTRSLQPCEIAAIYSNTAGLVNEYRTGARTCSHGDIFGNTVQAVNDVVWMTSKSLGKPCPVCGTPIEATPCAGTKMYFCPKCQIRKTK